MSRRRRRRAPASPLGGKIIESDLDPAIVALQKERVNEWTPGDNHWRRKRLETPKVQRAVAHKRGRGGKYPRRQSDAGSAAGGLFGTEAAALWQNSWRLGPDRRPE
jgi:hypothetical protein